MKGKSLLGVLLLGSAALPAYSQLLNLPPPPLSAYIAKTPPPPTLHERLRREYWYLQGWYLTGLAGTSFIKVNDIQNVTPGIDPSFLPPTVTTDVSEQATTYGASLGYTIRPAGGIFSRVELNYLTRPNIAYNANPFLQLIDSQINSKIDNHTLLVKAYDDFDFGIPLIPYIQAGAGGALNTTSGSANISGLVPGTVESSTNTDFAWDAGLGLRLRATHSLYFDVGYEFDSLGSANWDINFPDPLTPAQINLESGTIHSNTVLAGITWVPWPKIPCPPDN